MISVGRTIIKVVCGSRGDLGIDRIALLAKHIDDAVATADRNARSAERRRCHKLVLEAMSEIEHMGLDHG